MATLTPGDHPIRKVGLELKCDDPSCTWSYTLTDDRFADALVERHQRATETYREHGK